MPANLLARIPRAALLAGTLSTRAPQRDAMAVCQGTGGFKCVNQFYFTLCNGPNSVAQMVAPGTQCVNDQIVAINGPVGGNSTNGTGLGIAKSSTNSTVVTTVTTTKSGKASVSTSSGDESDETEDGTDDDDDDDSEDQDTTVDSSPKPPFAAGNSTSNLGAVTGPPLGLKTFSTRTATGSGSMSASRVSGSSSTTTKTSPAVITPGSGIPPDVVSGFTTSRAKSTSVPASGLEVIPVTSL